MEAPSLCSPNFIRPRWEPVHRYFNYDFDYVIKIALVSLVLYGFLSDSVIYPKKPKEQKKDPCLYRVPKLNNFFLL